MTRRELALLVRDEASYRLEVLWRLEQMAWQTKQTAEAVNRVSLTIEPVPSTTSRVR